MSELTSFYDVAIRDADIAIHWFNRSGIGSCRHSKQRSQRRSRRLMLVYRSELTSSRHRLRQLAVATTATHTTSVKRSVTIVDRCQNGQEAVFRQERRYPVRTSSTRYVNRLVHLSCNSIASGGALGSRLQVTGADDQFPVTLDPDADLSWFVSANVEAQPTPGDLFFIAVVLRLSVVVIVMTIHVVIVW